MLEAVEIIVAMETWGLMVNPGSPSTGGYRPLGRLCDVGRAGWGLLVSAPSGVGWECVTRGLRAREA